MLKKTIETVESFEKRIFQITLADLSNVSNHEVVRNIIEFKDIKVPFDIFKHCFFDNNYNHFEMNEQFRNFEALGINNKVVKKNSCFKNYTDGTKVNIIHILISNYMQNKKSRLDDIARISLIKDFGKFDSLLDFKVYSNHLSLDDVFTLFNHYKYKSTKKYFRFKIKATYYSSILDETISMYFNYIVKIPKNIIKEQTFDVDFYDEVNDEEFNDEESIVEEPIVEEPIVEEPIVEESIVEESITSNINPFFEPLLEINKADTLENIVYSNYTEKCKKENENINDDDDEDDTSESNMSECSSGINDSDNSAFF